MRPVSKLSFLLLAFILKGVMFSDIRAQLNNPAVYATYYGGNGNEWGNTIACDNNGNIIVAGATWSTNLNLVNQAQTDNKGEADIFITKFRSDMKTIVFSTYYGGSGWDGAFYTETDANGNIYITGRTNSSDFPVTDNAYDTIYNGGYDAFLVKMDSTGNIICSSYFGGSGDEDAYICLDDSLNIYLSGTTGSTDIPTKNALFNQSGGGEDAYLAKFNALNYDLEFSTYFGGTSDDKGTGAMAGTEIILYGITESDDLFTKNAYCSDISGTNDIFLVKINTTGDEIISSTYFGGNGYDEISSLIVDDNHSIAFTGFSTSTDIICSESAVSNTISGGTDIFMAITDSDISTLSYYSLAGGSGNDWGGEIMKSGDNSFYLLGTTRSEDYPVTGNSFQTEYHGHDDIYGANFGDMVFMKLNILTDTLLYSTYIGGSNNEGAIGGGHLGLCITDSLKVYISGHSTSTDFPVSDDALETDFLGGICDAVLIHFDFGREPVSTSDVYPYGSVVIYQLPFNDEIIIDTKSGSYDNCMYQLIALDGKVIKSGRLEYSNTIDMSDLKSGIYVLHLNLDNQIIVEKIIK